MPLTYLMLGSNSGNRYYYISEAITLLKQDIVKIVCESSLYETEPWGFQAPVKFLNKAIAVESNSDPFELLRATQKIENVLFRERKAERYVSRTIDIDILFYNSQIIATDQLKIPHPLIQERRFVLVPLMEIAPYFVHPVIGRTVERLLQECKDLKKVEKVN